MNTRTFLRSPHVQLLIGASFGIGLLFIVMGSYPRDWKPFIMTLLALGWCTLIIAELFVGNATIGDGPPVSKQKAPWIYWAFIFIQVGVLIIGLASINLDSFWHYDTYTIVGVILPVVFWLVVTFIVVVRRISKSRSSRSAFDIHQRFSRDTTGPKRS